jgi:predicted O-methyltransferase YrrM
MSRILHTCYIIPWFLWYRLRKKHKNGHGIHSPFVYNFIKNVLEKKPENEEFNKVESHISDLRKAKEKISVTNQGAGSRRLSQKTCSISSIAKISSLGKKYGRLLFHIANYFKPATIIELGTCLGIGTSYLAAGVPKAKVYSVEADHELYLRAQNTISKCTLNNVELIHGIFDEELPVFLKKIENVDLVFFDGNHRKNSTLKYFHQCLARRNNQTIFVFDDIRWSAGMYSAWKEIINHPDVTVSIDLFRMGIVFLKKELSKQNFLLYY